MPAEVGGFFRETPSGGLIVDGTAGGGGHVEVLLEACPGVRILGIERDPDAAAALAGRFSQEGRVTVRNASYVSIPELLTELGAGPASGALFDLGLSSLQLDDASRGFAHSADGPLDMRYDRTTGATAADLVNRLSKKDLADLFYRYGEEGRSRRIADAVVEARPIRTTAQLAAAVGGSVRGNPVKILSRVFQALRIAVNSELDHLGRLLDGLGAWTETGARVAFLTFHSLEDRAVKTFLRESPDFGPTTPPWSVPGPAELRANPRSRSARLRTGVRL